MRKPDLNPATAASDGESRKGAAQRNTTGRHLVVFRSDSIQEGIKLLESAGLKVVVSDSEVLKEDHVGDADVIVFPRLGAAIVSGDADQIQSLQTTASDSSSPIKSIREEKIMTAIEMMDEGSFPHGQPGISRAYLQGYRSAIVSLVDSLDGLNLSENPRSSAARPTPAATWDESRATWGLQATGVLPSRYSGRGVRVAVLDTGIDFQVERGPDGRDKITYHPDFEGRTIVTESFVPGAPTAKDGNGHGTHCAGTACGSIRPGILPRYGVAYESEIYVGKVLNVSGRGAEGWILAGIEWAIRMGCRIVSLSLGYPVEPGDQFDLDYETLARRALAGGTLLIAAAGNDSDRPDFVAPVGGPANCPSVMAVAAVSSNSPSAPFDVASFSNGGINPGGGEVDVAAPGVSVYSSYPLPTGHTRLNGTSMAAPHVAGLAALHAEANPGVTGKPLWDLLLRSVRVISLPATDVGAGLVQAP